MPKRRIQACEVQVQAPNSRYRSTSDSDATGTQNLVATVTFWGSASFCFDNTPSSTKLWQIQIDHAGYNNFSFKLVTVVNDMLRNHPDSNIIDTKGLEEQQKIRILNGAPSQQVADNDPDNMNFIPWRPVFYVAGDKLTHFFDLVHRILKYKVEMAHLLEVPSLQVQSKTRDWLQSEDELPEPWQLIHTDPEWLPSVFKVLPPRGRRHILCQLEAAEDDEYALMLMGGMYLFRDRLDSHKIQGGFAPSTDPTEKRQYVRILKVTDTEEGRQKISSLMERVFHNMPVYFFHYLHDKNNPLLKWILSQSNFILSPTPFEEN